MTVAAAAVLLVAYGLVKARLEEHARKVGITAVKTHGRAVQGIAMIETLKASGTDDAFFAHWAGHWLLVREQQAAAASKRCWGRCRTA